MSARRESVGGEGGGCSPQRPTTSADAVLRDDHGAGAAEAPETLEPAASAGCKQDGCVGGLHAWVITTYSGSRYVVVRGADRQWWFGGKNSPNPRSLALPPQLYRIEPPEPWPPVLGQPLVMDVPRDLVLGDPERAPGGGKVTSAVQHVESMSLREALARVGGHDGN